MASVGRALGKRTQLWHQAPPTSWVTTSAPEAVRPAQRGYPYVTSCTGPCRSRPVPRGEHRCVWGRDHAFFLLISVTRCHLPAPVFTVAGSAVLLSVLRMPLSVVWETAPAPLNGFLSGPKQASARHSFGRSLAQDSPGPCPSCDRGQRASLLFPSGKGPDHLPALAPPSAYTGCLIHAPPSVLAGVPCSSLDGNPRRVGPVLGWRGGGAFRKMLTPPLSTVARPRVLL